MPVSGVVEDVGCPDPDTNAIVGGVLNLHISAADRHKTKSSTPFSKGE